MTRKKKWILIGSGTAVAVTLAIGAFIASNAAKRFDPFIREQAVAYLSEHFNSDVELGSLKVRVPRLSPIEAAMRRGHGTTARVEGENLRLRQRTVSSDMPPLITIKKFHFDVDLGRIQQTPHIVEHVYVSGLEINVPPKGERRPITTPPSTPHPSLPQGAPL